ncbi:unnamed protein product [Pieris macdunnoughi]|uniref:Uncharacterized protein n=1 Tax=Pieris macdunnoughi TaxID=345717 RepID=A0A821VT66_9NEOP|nr:unnamed protein product [Pieris macdunnoughi]
MSGGRSIDKERKSPRESGEDSEDESEILEESPCGRWLKRREEVQLRSNCSARLSLRRSLTADSALAQLKVTVAFYTDNFSSPPS